MTKYLLNQKIRKQFLFIFFLSFGIFSSAQSYGYEEVIRQDTGENSSNFGPLSGDPVHVAHYFPASFLEDYQGMSLHQVEVFIFDTPQSLEIKIYGEGTETSPGELIYSKVVPVDDIYSEWVTIDLDEELIIGTEDLWIGYRVQGFYSVGNIGSDTGPANPGFGDWYSEDGENWYSFTTQNTWYNQNWNISGILKAPVVDENDVAVRSIIQPNSAANLGENEPITIEIKNYGSETQTSIPYTVTWDGQEYNGVYEGELASEQSVEVLLDVTADLSEYGIYTFEACTNLPGDQRTDLDCAEKEVENRVPSLCIDDLYAVGCDMDRIGSWNFANISLTDIQCPEDGSAYQDFRSEVHNLVAGETYTLTVSSTYINHYFAVWIDSNNNLEFTESELLIGDGFCEEADTEYTFEITIPEDFAVGEHVMRLRSGYGLPVEDACELISFGMTIDFTANIEGMMSTVELQKADFAVYPNPAKNEINIEATNNIKEISISDLSGRTLHHRTSLNENNLKLNVQNFPAGIYILRITDAEGKTNSKRVIIQ